MRHAFIFSFYTAFFIKLLQDEAFITKSFFRGYIAHIRFWVFRMHEVVLIFISQDRIIS